MHGEAMTARDADPLPHLQAERLQFDRYVLDLNSGCLLLDENEIALRPKTFAVLRHLVDNSGRLVSKDELFAAVWPNLVVTDDALVQSISELRRALGNDGARLIRTVPRRGYRFELTVSAVLPADPSSGPGVASSAASRGSALSPVPAEGARTKRPLATMLAGARGRLLAALAVLILLAVGAVWIGLGDEGELVTALLPGSPAKTADHDPKPAIAILPFSDESDAPAHAYFADGLTQDIINALGRFSSLTVMSWNAVFQYKDAPAGPEEIARSLGVRYQIEGSVREQDDRIHAIAQLVGADGRVLWSGRFDEARSDLFALQSKITMQIAGALAIHVTDIEQQRVFAKPTDSLEAYDFVLRARPSLQRPTREGNVQARAFLKQAVQLDPSYAAAYSALAESYYVAVSMGWAETPTIFLDRAEEMADRALNLDDTDVRARVVLGRIHILYHQYDQARAELDRAVATNPNDALGLAGQGNILLWLGQTDAALEELQQAQRIDPELNAMDGFALSLAYYLKQRYAAAIEQAKLNLRKTEGAYFSYVVLAAAYAQMDRPQDAADVANTVRRLDPTFDPRAFGSKLLNTGDLERLRDGLRKAGLEGTGSPPLAN